MMARMSNTEFVEWQVHFELSAEEQKQALKEAERKAR